MVVEGSAHDRARVVRRYLSALDASRTGRTPQRTAEALNLRMHQIDIALLSSDPVQRLHLTQERIDLHAEHLRLTTGALDLAELEKAFVRVAKGYGDRHGITFSAWRQCGVDTDVLAKAGIVSNKPARPAPAAAAPAAEKPAPGAPEKTEPVAEAAPAPVAEAKPAEKAPAKKRPPAKKAPAAAKKDAPAKNGASRVVKKAEAPKPEQEKLLS